MLDRNFPVEVYKNLHKDCYSIRQRGKVIAHVKNIKLKDVTFKVSEAGRKRVLESGQKNVHAVIRGYVSRRTELNAELETSSCSVTYNPYKFKTFVDSEEEPILRADFVDMEHDCDFCPVIAIFKD
jgi:predicted nucleotide-binding protein